MNKFKKYKNQLGALVIFLLAFLWMSHDFGVLKILDSRAQSLHQWRQTDCLSFTENYYSFGAKFMEPQVHNLASTEGRAAGEFPILYWVNAQIWKVFGRSEMLYRILGMLIAMCGFYALFRICCHLICDTLSAFVAPLVLYSSALFPYYAWNFLPNIPALSLAFIASWQLLQWKIRGNYLFLLVAVICASLAGLMKASSLIAPIAAFGTIIFFSLKKPKELIPVFASLFVIGLSLFLWYSYAKAYNVNYASNSFILDFVPIWSMSDQEVSEVITQFNLNWRNHFYSETAFFLFFCMGILSFLLSIINKQWKALVFLLLTLIGAVTYILLFFKNLGIHDYYLIELYVVPAVLVVSFIYNLNHFVQIKWLRPAVMFLFALFIYSESGHARSIMKERFGDFYNYHHLNFYHNLEDLESDFESLGILPSDLVISVPDESPNITLYLMNRRGFSNYGNMCRSVESIDKCITEGAKYLVVNDPSILSEEYFRIYTKQLIFRKEKLLIFKL